MNRLDRLWLETKSKSRIDDFYKIKELAVQARVTDQIARHYLTPLLEWGAQALILGCTHYPLLRPLLSELLPPDVQLVDPAVAAALRLGPLLAEQAEVPVGGRHDPHAHVQRVHPAHPADLERAAIEDLVEELPLNDHAGLAAFFGGVFMTPG